MAITPSAPPTTDAGVSSSTPRVLAVVVASSGSESLTAVLRTLEAQRYPKLTVMGVDNGATDDAGTILSRRLGPDRVIGMQTNVGFGRAVAAALRSDIGADIDYVLLVHDDIALMPDAVQWLVDAMESDPQLAVVGPKLLEWNDEALLQQVGMSADVLGRAESQLQQGELDQGQHDGRADVLYVSTAGMLVRREAFATLGGFDPRFGVFRDDMDLCWRMWLAGRRVEVVTDAVGYHVGLAAGGSRTGIDSTEARYLVERNTLLSMAKNYSARRLVWVIPLGVVLAIIRMVGLLLARRFGDSFAIARAYAYNLGQLPATLRRRRIVQSTRRQADSTLATLFTPGLPRLRQYGDRLLETVAGGNTRALVDADDIATTGIDSLADHPVRRFARDRPLLLLGVPLLVAFVASLGGFLGPGPIVGNEVVAWPASPSAFLQNYLSPWGGEPLASPSFASPVQAVLGILSTVLGGSAWFTQRVLVFGLVPLAFVTTLRAGLLVTNRPWPRVVGAAIYAVSPVVLGTVAQGRYGLAVVAALLPAVVSLTITTARPSTPPGAAWRSTALLSLAVLLTLGSAPVDGLVALAVVIVGVLVAILQGYLRPLLRLVVGGASALLLLSPWLFDLIREGGLAGNILGLGGGGPVAGTMPVWRALLGQPTSVAGLEGPVQVGMILIPAAVGLGALFVGLRSRPLITGALMLMFVLSGTAAWAAGWFGLPWLDPGALLLPGAVALSVLCIIVVRWSADMLTATDFGVAQVGTAVAAILLTVGLLSGMTLLASGPWSGLTRDPQLVPAFIGIDTARLGTYRVLLVDTDADGVVRWEVTGPDGPLMTQFGTIRDQGLTDLIGDTVTRIADGVGSSSAATLGVLNIRYVVVGQPDVALKTALSQQIDLEPLPSTAAVTYRVRTWLPRASVVPEPAAGRLLRTGDPGPTDAFATGALDLQRPGILRGGTNGESAGLLVVSEAESAAWRAAADQPGQQGVELDQIELGPINAFAVDVDQPGFRVVFGGGFRHRLIIALQVLIALAVISMAVRPPGAKVASRPQISLPQDLVGLADATTTFPRIPTQSPPPSEVGS